MMRLQFGAVLLTLQLCLPVALAQSSDNDIASCYTHCRDKIQDAEGWECSGSQECNCRTEGYLELLGCCMRDRCDTPPAAVFQIPCSPSDDEDDEDDEIRVAEASCPATSSETGPAATPTDRVGVNAVTSNSAEASTTSESESSATSESSSNPTSTDSVTSNEAPATGSSSSSSDDGEDNSLVLGLGLGLGIPLALAVVGLIAFLFYRARQRRRAAEATAAASNDPRQYNDAKSKMNPFNSPELPVYELSTSANAEPLPPNELPTQADDSMDAIPADSEFKAHSRSTSGAESDVTGNRRSRLGRHSLDTQQTPAPRNWDSRSTLVSLVTTSYAGGGAGRASSRPSRSIRSMPSRSVRSMTSEMLMRELPDLPPSARLGARSPEPISELP